MAQDPAAVAQKWVNRLSASGEDIRRGVQAVTVAPGQQAAAQADLWLAKVTQSKDKWRANVGRVSLGEWQDKMLNVGLGRIASGAQANQGKMQNFLAEFLPYLESGKSAIEAMPKLTIEDSIQRAAAQIRYNSRFVRRSR